MPSSRETSATMKSPKEPAGEEPQTPPAPPKSDFWKTLTGSLISAVVGGLIVAIPTNYFTTSMTGENERQQFLFGRSQSFSEYMALQYLPLSGDVPQDCQTRLQECRQLRQSAIQVYLFLPENAQKDLIRSHGARALEQTKYDPNLPPEVAAINNALKDVRGWVTGKKEVKEADFNFMLPCPDWKLEEKACHKPDQAKVSGL
jgi:hypothetical protein